MEYSGSNGSVIKMLTGLASPNFVLINLSKLSYIQTVNILTGSSFDLVDSA